MPIEVVKFNRPFKPFAQGLVEAQPPAGFEDRTKYKARQAFRWPGVGRVMPYLFSVPQEGVILPVVDVLYYRRYDVHNVAARLELGNQAYLGLGVEDQKWIPLRGGAFRAGGFVQGLKFRRFDEQGSDDSMLAFKIDTSKEQLEEALRDLTVEFQRRDKSLPILRVKAEPATLYGNERVESGLFSSIKLRDAVEVMGDDPLFLRTEIIRLPRGEAFANSHVGRLMSRVSQLLRAS